MDMPITLLVLFCGTLAFTVQAEERMLFDFESAEVAEDWWIVNDGVMGGLSRSAFQISDDQTLLFGGDLSLDNNGGFASVRARGANLALQAGEYVILRVRGDGREYNFNLYTPSRGRQFSYRHTFQTVKDEWVEVYLPVDDFVATWRGRVFRNETLQPEAVAGLGILLGDKQEGPFYLEVDWIKAGPPPASEHDSEAEA